VLVVGFVAAATILFWATASRPSPHGAWQSGSASDPWTAAQTIEPAALAKELSAGSAARPFVVCVGFHTLYEGAHIPRATFQGPASTSQGLASLKKWAQPLPRSVNLVIYCGCCPLAHCPNVRPAFFALRQMGFTHLRLLLIPHDFAHDWVQGGYPVAKGN
jgi:thiosulfate/3-mercaptopyruvate sulfurtransferase